MNSTGTKLERDHMYDKIRHWIISAVGDFSLRDIDIEFDLKDEDERRWRTQVINDLFESGDVERVGTKHGCFRTINRNLKEINWKTASTVEYDVKLPFDLHRYAKLFPKSMMVISGEKNTGKALRNGTPVLTRYGWCNIENFRPGYKVYGRNGTEETVTGVFPQGERECYRFKFNDGSFIDSDEDHIWTIQTAEQMYKKRSGHGALNPTYKKWINYTTKEIVDRFGVGRVTKIPPKTPNCQPIQMPYQSTKIDPYILGLLLGDGSIGGGSPSISTSDDEIKQSFIEKGYILKHGGGYDWRISTKPEKVVYPCKIRIGVWVKGYTTHTAPPEEHLRLKTHLKYMGLWGKKSGDKFIPENYLFNTEYIRTEILRGLMDTDGSIDKNGAIEFSSISKQLAEDVRFLARSLGGRVTIRKRKSYSCNNGIKKRCNDSYRVNIKINGVLIFKLKRKLERQQKLINKKTNERRIREIEYIGKHQTTCIKTSARDGLFIAKDFIVTHNTAVCLNIVKANMNQDKEISYFSSEMLETEFKVRLQSFQPNTKIEEWNFKPYHRTENFEDVIDPNGLNIIDFLEIHDKFYTVGKTMVNIFNRLETGIAIICVQKTAGSDHGRGGSFLIEKPRITVNLERKYGDDDLPDGATIHVTNVKFPRGNKNINNMRKDYRVYGGSDIMEITDWFHIKK